MGTSVVRRTLLNRSCSRIDPPVAVACGVWRVADGVWLVRTLRSTAGLHSGHAVLLRVRTSPESSLTTVAILQYIWFGWPDVLRWPRNCQQQTVAVDVAACLSALIDAIWEVGDCSRPPASVCVTVACQRLSLFWLPDWRGGDLNQRS
jgi:hypothetical protein